MRKRWVKAVAARCPVRRWRDLKTTLLNAQDPSARQLTVTLVELPPNRRVPSIRHDKTHEWIYVVRGSVVAELDNERVRLKQGDYLYLPPKVWHSFASGPMGLSALSIYRPGFSWKKPDVRVRG